MLFNLNEFLTSVSFALDFVEMDLRGAPSNHGKRTAYITLRIARELGLSQEELYDAAALAMLHDNGLSEFSLSERLKTGKSFDSARFEDLREHCVIGENNVRRYPFLTDARGIIRYHHERFDGTGFFGLEGRRIPLTAQIISAADSFENSFDLKNGGPSIREKAPAWISAGENRIFSPGIAQAFRRVAEDETFWSSLRDEAIAGALSEGIPTFRLDLSFDEIRNITGVFSRIIDSKSRFTQRHSRGLAEKAARMAEYYGKSPEEKTKLTIAADLHDLGKLAVPNSILDSPRGLTREEFEIVKKHVYYTRVALQNISGFEDITEWAANHHERLNGRGYPFGKVGAELDFNSRLMGCLDVYEALTEERPYRKGLTHREAMAILNKMKNDGLLDAEITADIDAALGTVK